MAEEKETKETKEAPKVTIRTLIAIAGNDFSLAAGDEWEVDEEVAAERIRLGLAEAVEVPAERRTVKRAGKEAETTSVKGGETRGA